jgi:two-component system phosphate regulon sensor histidine kinase PhoR
MAEGMILLDSDNTVLSVNRTAVQLFNPDYDPVSKLKLEEFTAEPQLWSLLKQLDNSNSARGIIKIGEQSWRTFLNKTEYAGKFGIVIILANVTESLKSEEIRRDFSANVSHELKTPLTTIKGFGEMMEGGIITESEDIKRYGGTIYRESERLLSLINDIIRLSEIEDENAASHMEQVELMQVAYDCEEILSDKAESHQIHMSVGGDTVSVMGNRSYLTELLLNLMDNSIKYNKPNGHVVATVTATSDGAKIEVEDDGIGIGEVDRERVFERFYRVDKSRSKETGGTGLGLSIVKHIVGLHGGTLDIKSELGQGTKITVRLPYTH